MILNIWGVVSDVPLHCALMTGRPKTPAKSPLGVVLQEIMEARSIATGAELALLLKQAGFRRMCQSRVSQWMHQSSRPQSVARFCYYLDKALMLTDDEKAAVAKALMRSEYPLPPEKPRDPKDPHVFWSSSSISHHGRLL